MRLPYTDTQKQRLTELGAPGDVAGRTFPDETEREQSFKKVARELAQQNKHRLNDLRGVSLRPAVRRMESLLVGILTGAGFVEVCTPTTVSRGMLVKMGITEGHPLWEQVFRLEDGTCLRPMLAPNLYYLLGRLGTLWPRPIRIFEIGQCFREESKGVRHLSEFTMLNLVEMGTESDPEQRLAELAGLVMEGLGMEYRLVVEESEVYKKTIDVMSGELELASGALGPHPLDKNWNITENWVGLGFGLERLVMVQEGFHNIRRAGRGLIYLDGARIDIH
ncbi:MAG: pyrrolysine--tRNA(Pyl) ligase large subunit [Thermodesulfovibrionales bacterium]